MTDLKKIIHIIPNLGSGGAERFVVDLVNELSIANDVTLVCLFDFIENINDFFKREVNPDVRILTLGKKVGLDINIYRKVRKVLNQLKPDVVNTHLSAINYVLPFSILFKRITFFHTVHSAPTHEAKTPIEMQTRKFFYSLGLITPITISNNSQEDFREFYNTDKDVLIFNGRSAIKETIKYEEVKLFVDKISNGGEKKVILNVGRFVPLKRQVLLAKVINDLSREGENVCLILLGADDTEQCRQIVADIAALNCRDIHVLNKRSNVADYLMTADGFCISSEIEGMPMSYIEAISVGCIPLSTPVGGLASLINPQIGFLAKNLSEKELKASVLSFLRASLPDLELKKENGIKQFEEVFLISQVAKKYLEVYEK